MKPGVTSARLGNNYIFLIVLQTSCSYSPPRRRHRHRALLLFIRFTSGAPDGKNPYLVRAELWQDYLIIILCRLVSFAGDNLARDNFRDIVFSHFKFHIITSLRKRTKKTVLCHISTVVLEIYLFEK